MGFRRKAREVALQVLYQLDVADGKVDGALEAIWDSFDIPETVRDYSGKLVHGIYQHLGEIDRGIESASENWSLERMSIVDRNILRLGAFELAYCSDVPFKVVIDEAVELGKRYGSEESGNFINGILDKFAKTSHYSQKS
ncbi:MAG: transcription antitermination factor NusB [Deltaproteobacteria bacterium]|nr:transcription antitermination factor NusB [Deltaproteobacteria bacterium]